MPSVWATMPRRILSFLDRLRTDSRLEWLVVASILALLALALVVGWIDLELPRPF
ncbi:MAG: hypothetical protein ACRDGN_07850 [bacterium]